MAVTAHIEGFDQARNVLDVLPDKFQVQVIRKMFRKAGQPVINDAKSRVVAHNPNLKKLADAIGFIPVRTKDPIVLIGIRVKGKYKHTGYIGHWIEYGVSGIKSQTWKSSTQPTPKDSSYRIWVASVPVGDYYRHDIPPQPFMRPAIDGKKTQVQGDVTLQFEQHLHTETEKALRRYRKGNSGAGYARAKNRAWYG
jgi:hypothetical protein